MNIVLLQCCKTKLEYKNKAKDLYVSPLFKFSLLYAKKLGPEAIHILSAKYGLLDLDSCIEPYNLTLKKMSISQRKEWSSKVAKELKQRYDLKKNVFIFLTGKSYREFLIPEITNYEIPLQGLSIGRQLQKLKQLTTKETGRKFNLCFPKK